MISAPASGGYAPPAPYRPPPAAPAARPAPPATCAGRCKLGLSGWRTGDGRLVFRCDGCGKVAHDVPAAAVVERDAGERAHTGNAWPPRGEGWGWAGFYQDAATGKWSMVARADTLAALWDLLDASWVHARTLAVPVRADAGGDEAAGAGGRAEGGTPATPIAPPPRPPAGLFFTPPAPPRQAVARQDERCNRCCSPVRVAWRTLSNGARVLWSRCIKCGRGGRAMPRTPENEAEAAANPAYEDARP